MKSETKAKFKVGLRKVGEAVLPWIIPTLVFSTIAAAWNGHITGERNKHELDEIKKWRERYTILGCANAEAVCELNDRMDELEAQNKKLLEEAMNFTEGKESV